jgi:hypothetical protein
MNSHNLDKLPDEAKRMIGLLFRQATVGWTNGYAFEVMLDNPVKNLLDGGEGLVSHGGNGSRCYLKHVGDPDWAVVHCCDEDWKALDVPNPSLDDLRRWSNCNDIA